MLVISIYIVFESESSTKHDVYVDLWIDVSNITPEFVLLKILFQKMYVLFPFKPWLFSVKPGVLVVYNILKVKVVKLL